MLRVTRLTDYATVVMACIALHPEVVLSTAQIAAEAQLELPTVRKLLKALSHAGLVDSFRGVHGGYRLARLPHEISLADMVEAIEGPIALTACGISDGCCDRGPRCDVRLGWQRVHRMLDGALRTVNLADLLPASAPAEILVDTLAPSDRVSL